MVKTIISYTYLYEQYWIKERSITEISKLSGWSIHTIHTKMKKFEIKRRTRSESLSGSKNPMFGKRGEETSMFGRRGSKSHMWQGGLDKINRAIRDTHQLNLWRTKVFERDGFICQFCNCKGGELNADHIVPLSEMIKQHNIQTIEDAYACKELWDINNGRTLCVPCHKTTESWGRQNMTKSDAHAR